MIGNVSKAKLYILVCLNNYATVGGIEMVEELKLDSKSYAATVKEAKQLCKDCPMCSQNIKSAKKYGAERVILSREINEFGDPSENLHVIGVDFSD